MSIYKRQKIFPRLQPVLSLCFLAHDLAKGSRYFQAHLLNQAPPSRNTMHSEVSALWGFLLAGELSQNDSFLPFMVYGVIRHHHTDLPNFNAMFVPHLSMEEMLEISSAMEYGELNQILTEAGLKLGNLSHDRFEARLNQFSARSMSFQARKALKTQSDATWLEFSYLFSLLIWADKNEAIFKSSHDDDATQHWTPELVDNYVSMLQGTADDTPIQIIRSEAYSELSGGPGNRARILSINIPTGSGKTLASLKVAQDLMQKHPQLERIIYCLPFTSIIDQNFKVFKKVLEHNNITPRSDMLLPHHHLVELVYTGELKELREDRAEFMIETWNSELVVTTFVQILMSFLSNRNRNLKRLHRVANSVLILDEVQTIPRKYWKLLNHVLTQISEQLNVYLILVTATQPLIFNPAAAEISELASSKLRWFEMINRVTLDRSALSDEIDIGQLGGIVCEDRAADPSLNRLVILNTIKSSLALHSHLAERLPPDKLLYLSSNIIPAHRLERIEKIRSSEQKGLVIVSTQVVEAGVDIDVDVVYRDLAPLDSIIQSCGRCNRNARNKNGVVRLFRLNDGNRQYWRYIYDEVLIDYTLRALDRFGDQIEEKDFYSLACEYYRQVSKFNNNDPSDQLLRLIKSWNFETALHPTHENSDAFRLMDDLPLKTVFVEVDGKAAELLSDYRRAQNLPGMDKFTRLQQKKDVIRKMNPYMITVPAKFFSGDQPFEVINQEQLCVMYDLTTGFRRDHIQQDYMF